jgi:hypothetical protein
MRRFLNSVVVVLLALPLSMQAVFTYGFDDDTLQGWTQVMSGPDINRRAVPAINQTAGTFRCDVPGDMEPLLSTIHSGTITSVTDEIPGVSGVNRVRMSFMLEDGGLDEYVL